MMRSTEIAIFLVKMHEVFEELFSEQTKSVSFWQVSLQPSPLSKLPSSQLYERTLIPSPHLQTHESPEVLK
jgi:hypothetical protein